MSLIIESRNADGELEEIAGFVDEKTIDVTENAEEGSVAMSTVLVDDPNLAVNLKGHRLFRIRDTEIVSGESVIYAGYTADKTYKRGRMPLSRQIDVSVADINSVWGRRVMVGADCKRPAETDVARMRWLITTAEAGLIDDDTYLSSASPVNMDKVDYRGQMMDQVANDCAQASGKNWGLTYRFAPGHGFQVWYGHDELTTYDSGVLITNILGDVDDMTSFYMAEDTTLAEDPARVFSGVMEDWEKGKVYRQKAATAHAFARRDTIMGGKLVKTKAKAIARANRYLNTLDEEDVRIETSILVPRVLGNVVRPFHRVRFQSTHLPGTIDTPIYCRVVKRRVSYWTPEFWRLGLTLVGGATASTASCSTAIAGIITEHLDNQSHAGGAVVLPITPIDGADSVIFGNAIALWGPINMHASGSMTELYSFGTADIDHPTAAHMYRAVAAASGSYNITATYTNSGHWAAVGVAIQTSATAPVQDKSDHGFAVTVTLDDPPTPGNLLVMQITERDNTAAGFMIPDDFWTEQVEAFGQFEIAGDVTTILTHCVVEGDVAGPFGSTADTSGVTVSEWVIS